jgi:hypothetical protein
VEFDMTDGDAGGLTAERLQRIRALADSVVRKPSTGENIEGVLGAGMIELLDEIDRLAAHAAPGDAEAKDGWISVDDRMPERPNVWVLVYADGAMNCMAWSEGAWHQWACSDDNPLFNIRPEEITHWHPLPAPPAAAARAPGRGEGKGEGSR